MLKLPAGIFTTGGIRSTTSRLAPMPRGQTSAKHTATTARRMAGDDGAGERQPGHPAIVLLLLQIDTDDLVDSPFYSGGIDPSDTVQELGGHVLGYSFSRLLFLLDGFFYERKYIIP